MAEVVREAKTIDKAISLALHELGCDREDAEIEVIQEPAKGLFGISKMAKVRVKCDKVANPGKELKAVAVDTIDDIEESGVKIENNDSDFQAEINNSKQILKEILIKMGISAPKIRIKQEEDAVYLDIHSDSEGLLIGRHGQTLAALQYLVNRIISHKFSGQGRIVVDVGGYRVRHKLILEKMAKRLAQKVMETKEKEQLKAMSAFDRRIIHMAVKDIPEIVTYSTGEGSLRHVVIAPQGSHIEDNINDSKEKQEND